MRTKRSILILALGLAALLGAQNADALSGTAAAAAPSAGPCRFGGLTVPARDVQSIQKPGYVFTTVDLFAQREAVAALGAKGKPPVLALALVRDLVAARYPAEKRFKVLLAEFPERDSYDAPRWDKIVVLGRYELLRSGKGFKLKKEAKP